MVVLPIAPALLRMKALQDSLPKTNQLDLLNALEA